MRRATPLPLAIAIALALAIAGCGEDKPKEERLTREVFIVRADKVCRDIAAKTRPVQRSYAQANEFPEVVYSVQAYIKVAEEGMLRLRELRPPVKLQGFFDRYLEAGEEAKTRLKNLEAAAQAEDTAAIERIGAEIESVQKGGELKGLATDIGFKECGGA